MKSYIVVTEELPLGRTQNSRKTGIFNVSSTSGSRLGEIRWYSPWRQYTFWPLPDTIFSAGCMQDIAAHIERLMLARATRAHPLTVLDHHG